MCQDTKNSKSVNKKVLPVIETFGFGVVEPCIDIVVFSVAKFVGAVPGDVCGAASDEFPGEDVLASAKYKS
ncbi:hypothetical protein DPMN_050506 [Dreissena polymorpha]|uniref:Uncharacterized protein n=1 Tax=Dreissena polymorpha TaxID=45954 RepID=A0A9D4CG94_DREPO|nr:hypothetical protein DPMN_050506 [Dreissena polymorpha]